jgi:hypothetical protein
MADHLSTILAELAGQLNDARHAGGIPAPPDFDEALYLRENPDVEVAIRAGRAPSAFLHYHFYGRYEGRARPTRVGAAG